MFSNPARGSGQKSSRMLNTFFRPEGGGWLRGLEPSLHDRPSFSRRFAPVKKFGRVRLSTNFPSKQIWRRMQTWKDDDFLLGFKFSRVQTSRKRFYDFLLWTFKTSGGVLYEQFMGDFTYHDSASRQVQYFKSL